MHRLQDKPRPLDTAPRLTRSPLAQARRARRTVAPVRVFVALLLCLTTALLLGSARLVASIASQPASLEREALLEVALGLHGLAERVGLDRPLHWLDQLLAHEPEPLAAGLASPPATSASPAGAPASPPPPTSSPLPPATSPPAPPGEPTTPATSAPTPASTSPPVVAIPSATPAAASTTSQPTVPAVAPAPTAPPTAPPTVPPTATATRPPRPTATPRPSPPPGTAQLPLPARAITAQAPLRVLTVGDSFAEWLGYDVATYGKRSGLVSGRLEFKISSGLSQPRFFNWSTRLSTMLAEPSPPEAVIIFLGANDGQTMTVGDRLVRAQTPEWRLEYGRRAAEIMEIVGRRGARLYWVELPVMRDPARNAVAADINAAIAAEAARRPWVQIIDTGALFGYPDEEYASYRPDASGERIKVRQDDGTHLTRVATTWVSNLAVAALQRDWKLAPER